MCEEGCRLVEVVKSVKAAEAVELGGWCSVYRLSHIVYRWFNVWLGFLIVGRASARQLDQRASAR